MFGIEQQKMVPSYLSQIRRLKTKQKQKLKNITLFDFGRKYKIMSASPLPKTNQNIEFCELKSHKLDQLLMLKEKTKVKKYRSEIDQQENKQTRAQKFMERTQKYSYTKGHDGTYKDRADDQSHEILREENKKMGHPEFYVIKRRKGQQQCLFLLKYIEFWQIDQFKYIHKKGMPKNILLPQDHRINSYLSNIDKQIFRQGRLIEYFYDPFTRKKNNCVLSMGLIYQFRNQS